MSVIMGIRLCFLIHKEFDKADINEANIKVTEEEIKKAYQQVDNKLLEILRKAKKSIEEYHTKQKQNSWFDASKEGIILGSKE